MPNRSPAPARRLPTQARSKLRYQAILDAAAVTFADLGFDAATMEQIAVAASTSIGSLYQFFPDKSALFRALADRCLERTRMTFETVLSAEAFRGPWPATIDAMIDGFALLHRSDPAFRAVLMNLQLYGLYAETDTALHGYIVAQIAAKLGELTPRLPPGKRTLMATMLVTTVATMLFMSQRAQPAAARALLAETKVMLRLYIAAQLGEPA